MRSTLLRYCVVVIMTGAIGCASEPALGRLLEARRITAELLVQVNKAADATNRVVMSNADNPPDGFAKQAEQAIAAVQQNTEALRPLLAGLQLTHEAQLLEEFSQRFEEYRVLDRRIHGLVLENTNAKAQQLSFGPAHESADAIRKALDQATRLAPPNDAWHARALTATIVAAVREIQVLQAPHIPEDDEAIMTRLEGQMAAAEVEARESLRMLTPLLPPASHVHLADATAALDRFMSLNTEITKLSRRNSNVQSLALSFGEKGALAARCEDLLRALQDALAKRGSSGTR